MSAEHTIEDERFIGVLLKDRYQVDEKLGQGGMAAIYGATDTELGRKVVVKVPLLKFLSEEGFKERFELEIQGMINIEHPYVVSIFAKGEHDGVPFFVIQYLAGGSLEDRVAEAEEQRIEPKQLAAWVNRIAEALDFIHQRDIVHRDIKPGNILFDEAGNVVLSDFGVAKALGDADSAMTAAGFSVGSPEYMAPEQAGGGALSAAADQYALATTVYECLAGRAPYQADNILVLLAKKNSEAPPHLSGLGFTQEVGDIVERGLAVDPEDRFASCLDFAEALELAIWSADPTPAPGMRTPLSLSSRSTAAGADTAAEVPIEHTIGGTLDFRGQVLLGHYKVGEKIGSGGMGTVYLAEDTDLGKDVVIKVPHPRLLADKGFLGRFEREVKQMLRIEHPGIVRVLARGQLQNMPFYVLQYLQGGSLSDRLKARDGRRMSAEDVLPWFQATSRALDFLHSRHLIHRDVKPGNILFDEYDHAYLSDFGIAKPTEEEDTHLTTTSTGVGSPRYMAPEQTGVDFDEAVDQYALATTVFEAIAGRNPFPEGTALEIMLRKMQEKPPSLATLVPEIPQAAADAVARALSADAAQRFPTCRAFFLAFKRGLRGEETGAGLAESRQFEVTESAAASAEAPVEPPPVEETAAPVQRKARTKPRPKPRAAPLERPRREPARAATTKRRAVRLWQPAFIVGFIAVWLLAKLAPFARFALPADVVGDVAPDVLVVLWACVPLALVLAIGHGWLFQTRGVAPAWAWVLATVIGAAIAVVGFLMLPRMLSIDPRFHPLGLIAGGATALLIGLCQWLALLERKVRRSHLWLLATLVGGLLGAALIELVGGEGGRHDLLVLLGAGFVMALTQLAALRAMLPTSAEGGTA